MQQACSKTGQRGPGSTFECFGTLPLHIRVIPACKLHFKVELHPLKVLHPGVCHREAVSEQGAVQITEGFALLKLRSEEHTSELQSRGHLVCRLLLEKKNDIKKFIR